MDRRQALRVMLRAAALAATARVEPTPAQVPTARPASAGRFDYATLKGRARALAASAYMAVPRQELPALAALDYERYQAIHANLGNALWHGERQPFRVHFFHLGLFYHQPVRLYEVLDGEARELAYDPARFDYGRSGLRGETLPRDLGFAGFRVALARDPSHDITAFLGASYFRAVGKEGQYGLSARGLAIDTGLSRPEEFPMFTHFWLERPRPGAHRMSIYALLDSPSVAGAYRIDLVPGDTLAMEVDAALYPRKAIERLGIAPLTSMFAYGENDRRIADDWRPEIHDSDGLALRTGAGEWLWRPLNNPERLRFNAYADENPRGFGLLQRDRDFDHYQDDGVFYERRPSAWIEPRGSWGKGSVQLVEIPTRDETFDNIVAFWCPARPVAAGEELLYSYRLSWGGASPARPTLAEVVATRTGMGGPPGQVRDHFSWRFVVDFAGDAITRLPARSAVEPVITITGGEIESAAARPLLAVRGFRVTFDVRPALKDSPVNLRLFLRLGDRALTETWLYQWTPPGDRRLYRS